jgi:MarR family transcriptional regulator, negative regulator of the multidrug operon emrRAB
MSARDINRLGALALALADRISANSTSEALVTLYDRGAGSRIDALAKVCALSHSGAVRLIDRLEAAGLVERRRGADQRSAAVFLTPAGRRSARRILADRHTNLQLAIDLLTVDQQRELAALTDILLRGLGTEPDAERRLCRLCDLDACGRRRGECPVTSRRRRPKR